MSYEEEDFEQCSFCGQEKFAEECDNCLCDHCDRGEDEICDCEE